MVLLAGGPGPYTLLSIAGFELLPFFSTEEACTLRLVCREFQGAVASFPWNDSETAIRDLALWRACFPKAKAAKLSQWEEFTDEDFVYLRGMHTLDMSRQVLVTDAAFSYLSGIQTLNMSSCSQETITDATFVHLTGIQDLNMSECTQDTISNAALACLVGVRSLDISNCSQHTITDAAFASLRGIHTLDMSGCKPAQHIG